MADKRMDVLVLAGRRAGKVDPLAQAHGVSDKCLVPLAGQPLIAHVLETLQAVSNIRKITVSVNEPEILAFLPVVRQLKRENRLSIIRSSDDLLSSILDGASQANFPLLITTADNVFISPQAIAEISSAADAAGAGAAVAFARREGVLAAHPEAQRRFYTFRDGGFSNCNSYWLADGSALTVAKVFKDGGQFAKYPMRIVSAFGFMNLIRFRLGLGTLEGAFTRFSRKIRTKIVPVILSDGKCAIDVDNERTHAIATAIMGEMLKRAA